MSHRLTTQTPINASYKRGHRITGGDMELTQSMSSILTCLEDNGGACIYNK